MNSTWIRLLAVVSLVAAIGMGTPVQSAQKPVRKVKTGTICLKPAPQKVSTKTAQKPDQKKTAANAPKALPKLLDLGATKCIPCKMMVSVLDELSKEYKGKLKVEFIDVWKHQSAAQKYKVQTIPTQIFFDAKGKEVYRHVGYFPKDGILKGFKTHGIKLAK
jgi:thioredoxin 1